MRIFAALLLFAALPLLADEVFPKPDWKDVPSPLASPDAVPGGALTSFGGQSPKSLNLYLENNSFVGQIFGMMYEALLGNDPLTVDFTPNLARRWTVSGDKRVFTFELDPAAKWSDGRPVTAADVKWTFDQILCPSNQTGPFKVALETFTNVPPQVLNERTIRFTAGEAHWRNLQALGGIQVLPAHAFSNANFNKINFEFPVVSGPYRLGSLKENVELRLERRADWWQRTRPAARGTLNFQTLVFRFFAEQENAFESFQKGELDIFPVYMSRLWNQDAVGEKYERHWIVKQKIYNHRPVGFQGFAMNMRRAPFDDLRVRQALAHLLNRDLMNRTMMFNAYFLHRSYFEDLYDTANPCTNTCYAFDPDKARALLQEAGWKPDAKTGLLAKNGQPLAFTFLSTEGSQDKFLALYSEDLKKVGIQLKIERKDGAAAAKDIDAFHFDMVWRAWGSGLFKDPEDMWSSREAERPSGNNITGFKDPRVDALIEKQKFLFDIQARNGICREIDALVAAQVPNVLLWNINYCRLLYWNKFGTPKTVYGKYGDESSVFDYWWYDADSDAELKNVMKSGAALPPRPDKVEFDAAFKP